MYHAFLKTNCVSYFKLKRVVVFNFADMFVATTLGGAGNDKGKH